MPKIIRFVLISVLLCTVVAHRTVGQGVVKTGSFLIHLNDLGQYQEGVYFIDKTIADAPPSLKDSLFYYAGLFNYQLKQIDKSIEAFGKVGRSSDRFYTHSKFLTAFQLAYSGKYERARELEELSFKGSPLMEELKLFELAGIALLDRDFGTFETYSSGFTNDFYQLSGMEEKLNLNKEGLLKAKQKSPLAAGILSGIVPGAGKFYVGKIGEGYTTLLISTILGLQVREAYKKDGVSSARFKLFTGLFGVVYVANIWGSVISVKTYKREIDETYDQAILVNMHVPLRTIFD